MIQSADKFTASEIFNIDKDIKYVVPKYQREYAWKKKNWEDLLDSILETDAGHFLGSLICVSRGKDTLKTIELEIIDGQQRLATLSLLYTAIYDLLVKIRNYQESNNIDDEELKNEIMNLKYRIIQKINKKETKLQLSEQNNNQHDFLTVLANANLIEFEEKCLNVGNRRIARAYYYFYDNLYEEDAFGKTKYKNYLLEVLHKINSALFVKIEVISMADAFTLFESINNTGIPLSPIDLIKNNLLAELEKQNILSVDDSFEKWQIIISNLPDEKVQERFLRHFYNAFKHKDGIGIKNVPRATRSNLIFIYEKLIERDSKLLLEEMQAKSKIYSYFTEEDNFKDNERLNLMLDDLLNVGSAPSLQFLLYLLESTKDKELILKVVDLIVKFFVRRNLTDFPATRDLDTIFINLIDTCEKDGLNFKNIYHYLTNSERFSPDTEFEKKLSGDIYEQNVGVTRFILAKIEQIESQTKERYTNFWSRDKKSKYIWTIEHIFPQGSNIPKDWIKMIGDGDRNKAEEIQSNLVHTIGNLTITGYNPNLSNRKFLDKRDKKSQGKYIGFKNGLFLNEDLKNKSSWKENDIVERRKKLVKMAMKLFRI